jgi:hypothetical protein
MAKYIAVSKIFFTMVATGPSLNISLCQKIFFIDGGNRTIAKYIAVSKNIFLSMAATGSLLNISLCQKIFFIYGGYRTIAKYIAVSKNIFYLWQQPDHR